MRTPILDFLKDYAHRDPVRMHMPGHKGKGPLGVERLDLTEVQGADSLYEASGIIAESERIAGELFGADTLYSAEGSSLSVRTMVYLTTLYAGERGKHPRILAGRNAHKSFITAVAWTGAEVEWLRSDSADGYLCCAVTPEAIAAALDGAEQPVTAVYLTCPDYLGNRADLSAIAEVCHERGVLLLVDNAHGAYLKFLSPSLHPMDLGADMCADSAHKTLPVLTGGGYLHISKNAPEELYDRARDAMSAFGSTSPSYLILASLDAANAYIAHGYSERLADTVAELNLLKKRLTEQGYSIVGDEPMKLTLRTPEYGYRGEELADILEKGGVSVEFSDREHLVLMPTPSDSEGITRLGEILLGAERREPLSADAPRIPEAQRVTSLREALLSPAERVSAESAVGRTVARCGLSCPPAVCLLMPGERVTEEFLPVLDFYGVKTVSVIK